MKQRILAALTALLLLTALVMPALALDDDEYNGYSADTLTIKVGYYGGPYYEKKVFTLEELWGMDIVKADYTFLDNMPSVIIDHVAGVRLADLVSEAGIDLNSVQNFYFWTRDKQNDYYTTYPKTALIDTPRYCYYSLPDNFDSETGKGNEFATSDGTLVDTVIALADDWNRCIAGATFGSDYMNLNTNTRFRLIFGQTDSSERTASRSAKWIHEIVVELGGAPTVTLDASVLEGEVGSVLRTHASVTADSAVLANEAVTWSSSDESIATVDENGTITVHGEGSAVITATFGGVSSSVTVNGSGAGGTDPGGTATDTPEQTAPAPSQTPSQTPGPSASSAPVQTAAPTAGAGETTGGAPGGASAAPKPSAAPSAPVSVKPIATPTPAPTPSQQPTETEQPGQAFELVQPQVQTDTTEGGVQNWRTYEMSETATALPNIELDSPLLGVTGLSAGGLLLASGAVYAVVFYKDVGRKKK